MNDFAANEFGAMPESEGGITVEFPQGFGRDAVIRINGVTIGRVTSVSVGPTKFFGLKEEPVEFVGIGPIGYEAEGTIEITRKAPARKVWVVSTGVSYECCGGVLAVCTTERLADAEAAEFMKKNGGSRNWCRDTWNQQVPGHKTWEGPSDRFVEIEEMDFIEEGT